MKDPLYGNKVAAVALIVLLLAFGLPITINTLTKVFAGHHGDHHEEGNPFGLAYIPTEIRIDGAAAVEEVPIDLGTMMANSSETRGERAAALCAACHTFAKGGDNGIGPNLWNVVGKDIASVDGYAYSSALSAVEGVWEYDRLDKYLENSAAYVPGTQMAQMVRKPEKRADILAYLGSLSDNPVPFPEPAPAPVEEETAATDEAESEEAVDG